VRHDNSQNAQARRGSGAGCGNYDITDDVRVSAVFCGAGGISGTDASSASHSMSRPDEFVCNEVAARLRRVGIVSRYAAHAGQPASHSPLPS